jgi:hypothetical protein
MPRPWSATEIELASTTIWMTGATPVPSALSSALSVSSSTTASKFGQAADAERPPRHHVAALGLGLGHDGHRSGPSLGLAAPPARRFKLGVLRGAARFSLHACQLRGFQQLRASARNSSRQRLNDVRLKMRRPSPSLDPGHRETRRPRRCRNRADRRHDRMQTSSRLSGRRRPAKALSGPESVRTHVPRSRSASGNRAGNASFLRI